MPANTRSSKSRDESMPYHYADGCLQFGINGFSFDGGDAGSPDYDDRTIPLYDYGDWSEVTLEGDVTIGNSVERVFPDDEGPPFPAELIVIVDAEETQLRFEKNVADPPVSEGSYDVELTLDRSLLRGDVVMTPRLVRTEPCRKGLPYAPNDGMRVAGGESWTVVVDHPTKDSDGFPFVYRDFSQDGMPSEDLVHSFSKTPNPKMMINDQNENVVDVLQSGNTYGFRPNMKRLLKADFGVSLWIQLVVLTGTTIAEAGEPEFDWQEGVVEEISESELGTHLFDENADYEAVVSELGDRISDPSKLRELITDLCEAVQLYQGYAEDLDYFIQEHSP
ncbi:hypothetical protein [Haloarcula amylolytica]|uniref:Uncharacterized protein n=1 Tax=Haloarcula amylolytica JCM 13557 TaxID=1227452 RepID=M0KWZ3_9EURY|nr:hypothetical protein [Haloarcula amylolytica]EMA25383.1 hypothetical protein C442_02956 [Haloarcula amylolytica JCM 13557]